MTVAALGAVCDALKLRIQTAYPTVRVYDTIPTKLEPPCVVVGLQDPFVDYDLTFGGGVTYWLTLRCFVGKSANEQRAQDALHAFASPTGSTSLYAAIEQDSTLGGVVDSTMCQKARGFGGVTVAEVQYLVIDIDIECLTS